ncbi:MAG: HAMP domain-containing histidine kinase [Ruminococcaceae bacterium]|nr:HAMP domain-containing histidine kinase [Oscillospiraceae bacterium]
MSKHKTTASGISIRWKLALYFGVFVAIVLIVTWLFQVYLLDTFYEDAKEDEMERSAELLSEYVESDQLPLEVYAHALRYSMSVSIYKTEGDTATLLVDRDAAGDIDAPENQETLASYYRMAYDNGGSYLGYFGIGGYEVKRVGFPDVFFGGSAELQREGIRMVHVRLVTGESGDRYMILLDSATQPMDSVARMLRTQFLWITTILLLCAAVMVFLLYRHISSPLVRMNEAAKRLAKGKYDTEFSGAGYLETRELAETLNYASHELSLLDGLQKELIANISHDLRTPLTMIKGYSEVMRDIPGENTPENMQVVIDETERLSALVNDILDLSRIRSGARVPEYEVLDLTAALDETMRRYDAFVRHRGYKISVNTDADAWVRADRGMLLQVLYNLINNAINYTGEDQSVTVTQRVSEGRVRISVADTGEGISQDQMPLIWDRYYKVDKVHRRAMIGTGLGLSIVKEILEVHGAAYGIDSTLGEGSVFWFELPTVPFDTKERGDEEETA